MKMNINVIFVFLSFLGVNLTAKPPKLWKENWFEHNQLLTLQYNDTDVAVYFDPDVDKSAATWINPFFHDVWIYVKKVYGKFGHDPILYGIFHSGKYSGCHSTTYFDRQKMYRNVIDCGGLENDIWKLGDGGEYDLIVGTISLIIQGASHGVNNNAAFAISGHNFDHIITYDVYLGINRTKDAQRWREIFINNHEDVLGKEVYWFKDWFLPIYQKYGGSEILNRFLKLLSQYFPQSNTATFKRPEYIRDMTYGEFFHFWSAATGKNLKQMATKVFGWNDKYENEFQNARKEFPQLVYYYDLPETWQENWRDHKEVLTKQFSDNEVAIYFDQNVDKSITWINKLLHNVWAYTKKNYGQFGPDPILYGIFHSGKFGGGHISTYFDSQKLYKNVIDCGSTNVGAWRTEIPEDVFFIIKLLSKVVQNAAHGVGKNPSFDLWGHTWDDIFALDVLLGINRTDEANRLYDEQLATYTNNPKPRTYWFRDWFVPIYEQYGGSKVLNRYFELLATYFPKELDENKKPKYSRNINFGEFVHFWSGAAQINLKGLAIEAFDWNQVYEKQYKNARKEFPDVTYNNIVIL